MRLCLTLACIAIIPALAQQRGQQRGMYGGVSTGQMVGVTNDPGFAGRLGATVSGLPQTTSRIPVGHGGVYGATVVNGGNQWRARGGRTVVVPYGMPMISGYFGGYGYGGYDGPPTTTIVQQPIQPAPSVIINQYYTPETANPVMREYTDLPEPAHGPRTEVERGQVRVNPPTPRPAAPKPPATKPSDAVVAERMEAATKPTLTLLTFTDSTVVAAIAYWQQGDQLHYVTNNYAKRVVAISTLDKEATEQINRDRNVEFRIELMR